LGVVSNKLRFQKKKMSVEEKEGLLSKSLKRKEKSYGSTNEKKENDFSQHLKVRHGDHDDYLIRVGDDLELFHPSCEKGCCVEKHGKLVEEVDSVTGHSSWRIVEYKMNARSPCVAQILNRFHTCCGTRKTKNSKSPKKMSTVIQIDEGGEQKCTIAVEGICCATEVAVVKKLLESVSGVKSVKTNVILRETKVIFDSSLVSSQKLVDKLNEASLGARVKNTTERQYDSIDDVDTKQEEDETSGMNLPKWNVLLAFLLWAFSMFHYAAPYVTRVLKRTRIGSKLPVHFELYLTNFQYLAVVSVILALPPIAIRALSSARRLTFDVNILMSVAVIGALGLQKYDEAAAVVVLFSLSDWLEMNASSRARSAIKAIIALRPDTAVLEETGEVVDVENVKVGT
jgi:copper chaperone CopZ